MSIGDYEMHLVNVPAGHKTLSRNETQLSAAPHAQKRRGRLIAPPSASGAVNLDAHASTQRSIHYLRQAPTVSNAALNVALGRITAFTFASSGL
jgi:hypothetical protein